MGVKRSVGSFVQSIFFGGTHEDLAFEVQVLKKEVAAIHQRIEHEVAELRDSIDRLNGKPGKDKGRARLTVVGGGDLQDALASDTAEEAEA